MKEHRILITCAGGPAAIGLLKSLKDVKKSIYTVAIDSDNLSAGFYLADTKYVVPSSDDPGYWEYVLRVIVEEGINLIIPTGDVDIVHFAKHKKILDDLGITTYFSDYSTIQICQDKYEFYKKCHQKYPLPDTSLVPFCLPIIKKPNRGSGSRGVSLYKSNEEIPLVKIVEEEQENYIYQEYLPGVEYSVDVLNDYEGTFVTCVIRERIQTKAGISTKGRIVKNTYIENLCKDLSMYLGLIGPSCIQLKNDKNNQPKVIEVNPRLGGGTYFSTLAGINIPGIILSLLEGDIINIQEPKQITVVRYYQEIVI